MSDQAVFVIIALAAVLSSGVTVMAMTRAGRSPRKRGQAMAARHWFPRPIGAAGSHMLVMGISYAIFSLSLLLQGQRWHQTPAYHNLLIIMPSGTWGVFFGAVALLLIAGAYQIRPLWLPYTAVLLGFMLTWSKISGALPSGLSLHAATGVISGIPAAAGSSTFVAQVTDSTGAIATSGSLTITVAATTLVVTTTSLPSGTVGSAYAAQLTAANGTPPYIWTLNSGGWPPGLSLSSSGLISGTPTAAGGSTATVKVTDSATPTPGTATSGSLPITVFAQLLNITTTSLPVGVPGVAYSATLAATGGVTPYTWSLATGSNPLPAGFSLNSSTGALSCASPVAGSAFVTFQVTDNAGTTDQQPLLVIVGVNTPGQVGVSVRSGGTWAASAPQVWDGSAWVPGSLYTLTSGGEWQ